MDLLLGNISTIKKKKDNISNEFTDNENDNNFISKSEVDKRIKEKKGSEHEKRQRITKLTMPVSRFHMVSESRCPKRERKIKGF